MVGDALGEPFGVAVGGCIGEVHWGCTGPGGCIQERQRGGWALHRQVELQHLMQVAAAMPPPHMPIAMHCTRLSCSTDLGAGPSGSKGVPSGWSNMGSCSTQHGSLQHTAWEPAPCAIRVTKGHHRGAWGGTFMAMSVTCVPPWPPVMPVTCVPHFGPPFHTPNMRVPQAGPPMHSPMGLSHDSPPMHSPSLCSPHVCHPPHLHSDLVKRVGLQQNLHVCSSRCAGGHECMQLGYAGWVQG